MQNQQSYITRLLNDYSGGNKNVIVDILPLVYNELKRISSKYLRDEHRNHTFQTTELVHEAFIKLIGNENISWESRAHFFGIAAQSMRQILVDYARKRNAIKRGSGKVPLQIDDAIMEISQQSDDQILALDEALNSLAQLEERSSKIVELRFFSGLTIEETAEVLSVSPATVKRDWNFAKAWLYNHMQKN